MSANRCITQLTCHWYSLSVPGLVDATTCTVAVGSPSRKQGEEEGERSKASAREVSPGTKERQRGEPTGRAAEPAGELSHECSWA